MCNDRGTQTQREKWNIIERHKPVYKAWLHTQTMNNEVSEDALVQFDISNKT